MAGNFQTVTESLNGTCDIEELQDKDDCKTLTLDSEQNLDPNLPTLIPGSNLVFCVEPSQEAFVQPYEIGHLFMNRFAIDEDAGFEILSFLEFEKSSVRISCPTNSRYANFETARRKKGIDLGAPY